MVETFTPAVCGSRTRQRVAAALFALSAVATAAALGTLLGLVGGTLGADRAVYAAAALALLAAAREAGLVRLPLPQSRRQVPERWRFELPLPVWAAGYGAGLGAGFLTYQPLATFWVACAGALALARPLPAAVCFALYGAGRALTLVWPRRRGVEATEAVERIVARRPALLRANVAGLAACAALLALAPAAEGARVAWGLDPTISRGVLAVGKQNGSVLIRPPGGADIVLEGASAPSIDRGLLAYVDAGGIRVVRWRTCAGGSASCDQVARIAGNVSLPSLNWPLIAFRRELKRTHRLELMNLKTGSRSVVRRASLPTDLGRPSVRAGRLAWHTTNRKGSYITLMTLSNGRRRIIVRTKVALVRNPALTHTRMLYTVERSGNARVRLMSLSSRRGQTLRTIRSRDLGYWTTALDGRGAYVTRWSLRTTTANVHRYGY